MQRIGTKPPLRGKAGLIGAVGAAAAALLIVFVPEHEGVVLTTYPDPALGWAVPTVCAGHTGHGAVRGRTYTPPECETMLVEDLAAHAAGVRECVGAALTDGEAVAWVSFAFNVGVQRFCTSTAARLINEGRRMEACAQLSRWVYAGGRKLKGLERRRAAERSVCESGVKSK